MLRNTSNVLRTDSKKHGWWTGIRTRNLTSHKILRVFFSLIGEGLFPKNRQVLNFRWHFFETIRQLEFRSFKFFGFVEDGWKVFRKKSSVSVDNGAFGSYPMTSRYAHRAVERLNGHEIQKQCSGYMLGSACGAVGRAVASDTRDQRFESYHRQIIYLLIIC